MKIGACLEQESKLVQAEYKDAVERVTVVAKAWDKPNRNRTRWDKLMRPISLRQLHQARMRLREEYDQGKQYAGEQCGACLQDQSLPHAHRHA